METDQAAGAGAVPAGAVPPLPAAAGAAPSSRPQLAPSGNATADKVAAGLVWGGEALASGVTRVASTASGMIQNYVEKQTKEGKPGEAAKVSPALKTSLKVVAKVAAMTASVTGRLAALVGDASYATALAIAKAMPGHEKRKSAPAANTGEVTPEERSALKTVGAAGLMAYVQVYDSLEQAAKQVMAHSMEGTHQYIHYKYGEEAGQVAKESLPAAEDMLQATLNFSRLGARAFISKTASRTAKTYLKSTMAGLHPDEQAEARNASRTQRAAPAGAPAPKK